MLKSFIIALFIDSSFALTIHESEEDMRVLLFGASGYVGQSIARSYPEAILAPSVDIAIRDQVRAALAKYRPDVVINAAGKTGRPNVDWCESHKVETLHSNVLGPFVLLEECQHASTYLVHLSTGCLYTGDNGGLGFSELDQPNFFGSFYSRTKADVEKVLDEFPVLQLRLRMPFDGSLHERNLITKLAKHEKLIDQDNSITYLPDFLKAMKTLVDRQRTGIYNIVNKGHSSPFKIMLLYRDIIEPSKAFSKISNDELALLTKAGRSNCTLNTSKLEKEGILMMETDAALREALLLMKENLSVESN